MRLPPLSVLEFAVIERGHSGPEALAATLATVRRADELGMHRVWFAEHHDIPGVASVAPPVLVAHAAATTARIRIGSGGVLLPNHAPRLVAEQFATLDALHPGRIDLGIGRGPGTIDASIIAALRRGAGPTTDANYRADLVELLDHLSPEHAASILPGSTPAVEPWILAASPASATLAGELGLPVAVAHHIRPQGTVETTARYRDAFRPSAWRDRPHVMVSVHAVCAETDSEVAAMSRPINITRAARDAGGTDWLRTPPLSPAEAAEVTFDPEVEERLVQYGAQQAYGTPETAVDRLAELAKETGADEIMLAAAIYDPVARRRSLELVVQATA